MEDDSLVALTPVLAISARPLLVRVLWRPSVVAGSVYLFFLLFLVLTRGYTILDFVHLGTVWSQHNRSGSWGYDGQFYYQLARNPFTAYHFMDDAPYRYQRILYPLLVSLLCLKSALLIPYGLLLVNLGAILASVEIAAQMLSKRHLSPWYALALGLYYGQAAALSFDTGEPFSCLLVCIGIYLLLEDRVRAAAICLGLACLSREVLILFPLGYMVQFSLQRQWRAVALLVIYGCVPILLWLCVLGLIFGRTGLTFTPSFEHMPFAGILYYRATPRKFLLLAWLALLPTLGNMFLCLWELLCRRPGYGLVAWILNLGVVIFLSRFSYLDLISCGRITIPLVLAFLFYGIVTRNRVMLGCAQFYAFTFLLFCGGVVLHLPAFLL